MKPIHFSSANRHRNVLPFSGRFSGGLCLTAAVFLVCVTVFIGSILSVSDSTAQAQAENLQLALTRSAVHCYAVEGRYPESLDYLQEEYGIHWDKEQYAVDYEIFGANMLPVITVIPLS